ncbi:MAG TPA: translation initiation factor IF-3 [Actinobacteria bacterium]|nr:translation initiation factor IF-3 [Actinomycetota bacterium]
MRINEQIRVPKIRLISEEGEQIGVVPVEKALALANAADLDLVEVAPDADPPVCRIMDYGKYKYKLEISEKERKKKQSQITVKEIKIRPKIDKNDFIIKEKYIEKFLTEGHKVKITINFRGREIIHKEIGENLASKIIEDLDGKFVLEQAPKLEGFNITMVLNPL